MKRDLPEAVERYLQSGLSLIEQRRGLVDTLREQAQVPYMHSLLDTFVAKVAGKADFRIEGEQHRQELADAVFTTAWAKMAKRRVEAAIRDFAVCGFGAVFVSPHGPRRLPPEEATWLGEMAEPFGHVRRFSMPVADARHTYGNHWPDAADAEETLDFVEIHLQHTGELFHVCLSGERTVVQQWEGYPYESRWLFGAERARTDVFWATGLPVSVVELCQDWLDAERFLAEAVKFRAKRSRLAQLNTSALTDMDTPEVLSQSYRLIPASADVPIIRPIDEVSLADIQLASELSERKISAVSGVGLFDQNLLPDTKTATEAMYYAQLGSARSQFLLEQIRQWMNAVAHDFRHWLVRLPDDHVPFLRVMVGDTEETYGPHRHVRDALEGMRVTLLGAGWEDVLSRQQKAQALLQLAVAMPSAFDMERVLQYYLHSLGVDAREFLMASEPPSR
jgi:hypothetical protein